MIYACIYHNRTLCISLIARSKLIGRDMCSHQMEEAENTRAAAAGPSLEFGDDRLRKRQLEIRWGKPLWMERVGLNAL
jgi:hypothetical protein